MSSDLEGKRIAILATDGFEQSELLKPKEALESAGAETDVISIKGGRIKGWDMDKWGQEVEVNLNVAEADPARYDALLLPGGVMNPDKLRVEPKAVEFARQFFISEKLVAAICHGPWLLVEAGVVQGRTLTSWPSLKTDIRNAGGSWVDEEVSSDRNLITSRKPDDIPAFNKKFIETLAQGGGAAKAAG
ncbi:MAG: PfpI family intracellular protease [Bryobacterales bacterium]|jgi:protease I|nr:PfpI family intracellular protease [Bryobacterales bacterium]